MLNYSKIQQFLHDIVLKNSFINKSLFEIEKIVFSKKKNIKYETHIFITGLPRSGTTSILNFFYSLKEFGSLTYKNMPFILSPNLSKSFNRKNIVKKERLHGDNIKYDLNSPEAFDEIFFNNEINFINNELLNYLELILLSEGKTKYLSKNNMNYKRINIINSILPNSLFLIPIREPLQQIYSIYRQHEKFLNLQKKNDFVRRYMNYLGHYEFGVDHKPWNKIVHFGDPNDINYWLEQWYLFYKNIFYSYNNHNNCKYVDYSKLTDHNYVKNLIKWVKLDGSDIKNINYFKNSDKKDLELKIDKNLYEKSRELYLKFQLKS